MFARKPLQSSEYLIPVPTQEFPRFLHFSKYHQGKSSIISITARTTKHHSCWIATVSIYFCWRQHLSRVCPPHSYRQLSNHGRSGCLGRVRERTESREEDCSFCRKTQDISIVRSTLPSHQCRCYLAQILPEAEMPRCCCLKTIDLTYHFQIWTKRSPAHTIGQELSQERNSQEIRG